jgi:hypothetical protein
MSAQPSKDSGSLKLALMSFSICSISYAFIIGSFFALATAVQQIYGFAPWFRIEACNKTLLLLTQRYA